VGPFTGRQLTLIIVSLVIAVALPVGAFAAGQAVTITDPVTNAQAKVDANGNLLTKLKTGTAVNNTTANPVPVNEASSPLQLTLPSPGLTRDAPYASGDLYTVPAGKVLTVEFASVYISAPIRLREANFLVGCIASAPPIQNGLVKLPLANTGTAYTSAGGPLQLFVPAGGCLRYQFGAESADICVGCTWNVNGYVNGSLRSAS
jgi:hypothetical protein